LRPGEKLYEELSFDYENVSKTKHEMIFVCNSENPKESDVLRALSVFCEALSGNDEEFIKAYLFQMVSEKFRSYDGVPVEKSHISHELLRINGKVAAEA
jgi:FlaA1/EpsC-like NDP-sugar epimerase